MPWMIQMAFNFLWPGKDSISIGRDNGLLIIQHKAIIKPMLAFLTPGFKEVERGVYWFHLVHLSVRPSVDRIMSALYLQKYS